MTISATSQADPIASASSVTATVRPSIVATHTSLSQAKPSSDALAPTTSRLNASRHCRDKNAFGLAALATMVSARRMPTISPRSATRRSGSGGAGTANDSAKGTNASVLSQVFDMTMMPSETVQRASVGSPTIPVTTGPRHSTTRSAIQTTASIDQPSAARNGASSPNGMVIALRSASGITPSETIGMAARFANRPNGATR